MGQSGGIVKELAKLHAMKDGEGGKGSAKGNKGKGKGKDEVDNDTVKHYCDYDLNYLFIKPP